MKAKDEAALLQAAEAALQAPRRNVKALVAVRTALLAVPGSAMVHLMANEKNVAAAAAILREVRASAPPRFSRSRERARKETKKEAKADPEMLSAIARLLPSSDDLTACVLPA